MYSAVQLPPSVFDLSSWDGALARSMYHAELSAAMFDRWQPDEDDGSNDADDLCQKLPRELSRKCAALLLHCQSLLTHRIASAIPTAPHWKSSSASDSQSSLLIQAVRRTLTGELAQITEDAINLAIDNALSLTRYLTRATAAVNQCGENKDEVEMEDEDGEEDEDEDEDGEEDEDENDRKKRRQLPARRLLQLLYIAVQSNPSLSAAAKSVLSRPLCPVALHEVGQVVTLELLTTARANAASCSFPSTRVDGRRRLLTSHVIGALMGDAELRQMWLSLGLPLSVPPSSYIPSSSSRVASQQAMARLDMERSWYHQPEQVAAMLAHIEQQQLVQLQCGDCKYYQRYRIQPIQYFGSVKGGTFARMRRDCEDAIDVHCNIYLENL